MLGTLCDVRPLTLRCSKGTMLMMSPRYGDGCACVALLRIADGQGLQSAILKIFYHVGRCGGAGCQFATLTCQQ